MRLSASNSMIEIINPIIIFTVGAIAGFINIMAGGGSTLTLGAMILMGLDAAVANGTNRIGILIETISASAAYKSKRFGNLKKSLLLVSCAVPGAIIGSFFAVKISNAAFQRILTGVMIFIVITLFLPKKTSQNIEDISGLRKYLIYPAMFLVGLYGGFIQAGVGFLIMASLRHLTRLDLININMHKIHIVLFYTIPILFVFGFTNNINWLYAICLGMGFALGAWISVIISIKKGEKIVKAVLGVAILIMVIKFLLTF